MKKLILVVFGVLLSVPSIALSCSCASTAKSETEEVQLSLSAASAVFLAKAISIEIFPTKLDDDDLESQRVRWQIRKLWKGPYSVGQVVITETVTTCCVCGQRVTKGQEFLLFQYEPEPFSISNCSLSGEVSKRKKQILLLDKLTGK